MKRLSIYLTETRASVTVENGITRETGAGTMPELLRGMPAEDRLVLERFCQAVIEWCGPDEAEERRMFAELTKGGKP